LEFNVICGIYFFNNNIINQTILFTSFGLDSATNKVITVKASGVIFSLNSKPTLCKNHIKVNAPVLLFPSVKG